VIVTAQGSGDVLLRTLLTVLGGQVRTLILMDGLQGGVVAALVEP